MHFYDYVLGFNRLSLDYETKYSLVTMLGRCCRFVRVVLRDNNFSFTGEF